VRRRRVTAKDKKHNSAQSATSMHGLYPPKNTCGPLQRGSTAAAASTNLRHCRRPRWARPSASAPDPRTHKAAVRLTTLLSGETSRSNLRCYVGDNPEAVDIVFGESKGRVGGFVVPGQRGIGMGWVGLCCRLSGG
jgi:hypothetical protein